MYTNTIYSNRFYKDEYPFLLNIFNEIDTTIIQFNRMLFHTYNLLFLEIKDKQLYEKKINNYNSLHLYVKNTFHIDDYYANSIIRLAKGKLTSQLELQKLYKSQIQENLKSKQEKLKQSEESLKYYLSLRDEFLKYRDDYYKNYLPNNKNKKLNHKMKIKHFKHISVNNDSVVVRYFKNKEIKTVNYNLYSFEYEYLNKKIKHLKNLIGKYKHRISNLQHKLIRIEKLKPIIFGSKQLMREYSHSIGTKNEIKYFNKLINKKYREFNISGRKDAGYGNFIFKTTYIPSKNNFNIEYKLMDRTKYIWKDVFIPYRKEEFLNALHNETPISIGIIKKIDKNNRVYYQFKISFDLEISHQINDDISTGIVGMDFNIGHLDISDIDANGNLVNSFTIHYNVSKSSNENEISLRKALNQVGEYVKAKHKCLVIENLDTTKSKQQHNKDTKDKDFNRIIHSFATSKYDSFTSYIGIKYEFKIYKVSPKYTSIIGKYKYANQKKLNSHIAASFVIARRGLKFKDYLLKEQKKLLTPNELTKHHWSQWFKYNNLVSC